MQTSFGHSVPVYDMERTICDLLRSRKNVEMQVFKKIILMLLIFHGMQL